MLMERIEGASGFMSELSLKKNAELSGQPVDVEKPSEEAVSRIFRASQLIRQNLQDTLHYKLQR